MFSAVEFALAAVPAVHVRVEHQAAPGEHGLACSTHAPNDSVAAKIRSEVAQQLQAAPPYHFPAAYVKKALSSSVDYRYADQNDAGVVAVTPGKDQGAHG